MGPRRRARGRGVAPPARDEVVRLARGPARAARTPPGWSTTASGPTGSRRSWTARGAEALVFHNVTPPRFLPPGPVADRCRRALDELPRPGGRVGPRPRRLHLQRRRSAPRGVRRGRGGAPAPAATVPRTTAGEREDSVLFVGRISPSKGVDDLVKAFALLRALHRPSRHPAPGRATLGLGAPAAGLEALVEDRLRRDRLPRGGAATPSATPSTPARGSCAWLSPSRGLLRADHRGAAGAPVVARDVGAVAETMGEGGVLLPGGDPRLAAEALAEVLTNPRLRETPRTGADADARADRASRGRGAPSCETLGAILR